MKLSCRLCGSPLSLTFCDLGMSPLANSYVPFDRLDQGEMFFPLHAYLCETCLLVQLAEFESPEGIFSDYAYFSSISSSWLAHAKAYVHTVHERFGLGSHSQVIEVASNDGYLLQYFVELGVPVLGIEPAANVAEAAVARGIPTRVEFFGTEAAARLRADGITASLLAANNVLAHVPDLNDFIEGAATVLAPDGVITMEFPHLLNLMRFSQFDTIYHEHFSYFSFATVTTAFARHGLQIFDVDQLPTHGGSLRIYASHAACRTHQRTARVDALEAEERAAGLYDIETYAAFAEQTRRTKRSVLRFLLDCAEQGRSVVAYGAAAKGATLLNYLGAGTDLIECAVDQSPHKQDHCIPGCRIPIHAPDVVRERRPDYLLILPWNLKDEIMRDMAYIREWGGKFVIPIPEIEVLP